MNARYSQFNKKRSIEKHINDIVRSDDVTNYTGKEFEVVNLDEIPVSLTELSNKNYAIAWRFGGDEIIAQTRDDFKLNMLIMTRKDSRNEVLLKACDVITEMFYPQTGIIVYDFSKDPIEQVNSIVILNIVDLKGIGELVQGFKFREYVVSLTMRI